MEYGQLIIDAVIKANALQEAHLTEEGTIFVWRANAAEQIEAALEEPFSKLHKERDDARIMCNNNAERLATCYCERDDAIAELDQLRSALAATESELLNERKTVAVLQEEKDAALDENKLNLQCYEIAKEDREAARAAEAAALAKLADVTERRDDLIDALAAMTEERDKLKHEITTDSWSAEMQRALELIPIEFVQNDMWYAGIDRMAKELNELRRLRTETLERYLTGEQKKIIAERDALRAENESLVNEKKKMENEFSKTGSLALFYVVELEHAMERIVKFQDYVFYVATHHHEGDGEFNDKTIAAAKI